MSESRSEQSASVELLELSHGFYGLREYESFEMALLASRRLLDEDDPPAVPVAILVNGEVYYVFRYGIGPNTPHGWVSASDEDRTEIAEHVAKARGRSL